MSDQSNDKDRPITLEEVLVAFQKSLARSCRNMVAVGKSNEEILSGNRSLYAIGSLDVELRADVAMHDAKGIFSGDRIFLNLPEPGRASPTNTTLRFKVESRPVEAVTGAGITLSQFKPLEWQGRDCWFAVRVTDQSGRSAADCPVILRFTSEGARSVSWEWRANTNPLGNVVFSIDTTTGEVVVTDGTKVKAPRSGKLDFTKAGTWYVTAECLLTIDGAERVLSSENYAVRGISD